MALSDKTPAFVPEPLRCLANEVYFSSDGTRIARVHFNEDTITEDEARAYAAQFAASTALKATLTAAKSMLITFGGDPRNYPNGRIDGDQCQIALLDEIDAALAACVPLPKGRPFSKPYRPQDNPCVTKASGAREGTPNA